ncbi:MAG TPA: MBL fold metallo-hydrolase [Kofleriaceae bacterium]|jgi:phosphoribosyl 1,2-cyclic phosphodiesterase|nr:MBL fold metallo-hydrolase [Kofleriaceae bacterium]
MRVRFFGVRGSIPTPGPSTVRYGGNSVCVEVKLADGTRIILDAGTGIRECGKQLEHDGHTGPLHLFITHSHWDHVIGMPFFGPMYRKGQRILMHPVTAAGSLRMANPIMFDGEHFPVRFHDLPAQIEHTEAKHEHRIGSARVTAIALNHPGGAVGFRIDDDGGSSMCYLTDNELFPPAGQVTAPDELARFAAGTSLLIHDAQYLASDMPGKRGWGHSQVDEVLALARDAEARAVVLHHHDPDRDDAALDAIAGDAARWAQGHAPALETIVAREGLDVEL